MRKRAALARALALDPPLLFCDEPSAGLDPVTSAGLDDLLLKLRTMLGITVVVVTHELYSIEKIADSIIFLHKGSLLFEGSYKEAVKIDQGPINDFSSGTSQIVTKTTAADSISIWRAKNEYFKGSTRPAGCIPYHWNRSADSFAVVPLGLKLSDKYNEYVAIFRRVAKRPRTGCSGKI